MTQYADPIAALLLEPVPLEYIRSALAQENVDSLTTPTGEVVYRLGQGDLRVMLITGFSLYSYRLVNSLALLLIESTRDVRGVRVPGDHALSRVTLFFCFPVNKFAYSRPIVSDRKYKRSLMDEYGNLVIGDLLTLQSTSASMLHSTVTYLRPDVLVVMYSDRELSRYTMTEIVKPVLYVASHSRDVEEALIESLSGRLSGFRVARLNHMDLQLPHSHFYLELSVSAVLVIVMPFTIEAIPYMCNCITTIASSIAELGNAITKLRERELREVKSAVLEVRPPLTIRRLAMILEQHGFSTSIEDESRLRVTYFRDIPLHRVLIEEHMLEEYFNAKISSIY